MNFQAKRWFYCILQWWLFSSSNTNRSKPSANFQPIPGQNPKQLFTVHAYSLEQARALVAAKVAGETIVRRSNRSP
jgi:hypothetical protein